MYRLLRSMPCTFTFPIPPLSVCHKNPDGDFSGTKKNYSIFVGVKTTKFPRFFLQIFEKYWIIRFWIFALLDFLGKKRASGDQLVL